MSAPYLFEAPAHLDVGKVALVVVGAVLALGVALQVSGDAAPVPSGASASAQAGASAANASTPYLDESQVLLLDPPAERAAGIFEPAPKF